MEFKRCAILILFLITITVLLYAGFIIYLTWPISQYSIEKAGQFGDSFGILTALFSGLAFSGLIITILLQRKELELQRKELRLQREEMAASRGELAAQVSAQRALFLAGVTHLRGF